MCHLSVYVNDDKVLENDVQIHFDHPTISLYTALSCEGEKEEDEAAMSHLIHWITHACPDGAFRSDFMFFVSSVEQLKESKKLIYLYNNSAQTEQRGRKGHTCGRFHVDILCRNVDTGDRRPWKQKVKRNEMKRFVFSSRRIEATIQFSSDNI